MPAGTFWYDSSLFDDEYFRKMFRKNICEEFSKHPHPHIVVYWPGICRAGFVSNKSTLRMLLNRLRFGKIRRVKK